MLTPTFHFKILEQFLTIMNEHSKHLTLILRDNHHTDGRAFDISPYITRTTLGMICGLISHMISNLK
jgi:cytochrome P450 family 4